MKISTLSKLIVLVSMLFLAILSLITYQVMTLQDDLTYQGGHGPLSSYQLADELRQSSEDLTRMARQYVITGNPDYKENYLDILAIRNGELARPEGSTTYWHAELTAHQRDSSDESKKIPLQVLIKNMGFTAYELSLISQALERSDTLVKLEKRAFAAREGLFEDKSGKFAVVGAQDGQRASQLLFSMEYERAKIAIIKPIQEFRSLVEVRYKQTFAANQEKQRNYILCGIIIILVSLGLLFFLFSYSQKRITQPLTLLEEEAQKIAHGEYHARCNIQANNELGSLSDSLNTMAEAIETDFKKLETLATVDDLTGVCNRRHFMMLMEGEMKRAYRYGTPLTLLVLDIDHFKIFNDDYGHHVGDEVLKLVSSTCQDQLRDIDFIGRLGGEEFGILLPATNLDSGLVAAERICKAVENISFEHGDQVLHVSISVGATQQDKDEGLENLLQRADRAMYQAKEAGRNCVSSL